MVSYEAAFTPQEIVVRVRYRSEKPLDPTAEAVLSKVLQTKLAVEKLRLVTEQEAPPAAKARKGARR